MVADIKIMLGDAVSNYSDAQISLAYKQALTEVEAYCNREADIELDMLADRIAVINDDLLASIFSCTFIGSSHTAFRSGIARSFSNCL